MDLTLNLSDLSQPSDVVQLKRAISTIADECDTLYTTTAPNGVISARIGRRAIYNNSGSYTTWINVDGDTTWVRMQDYDVNIITIPTPDRGSIPEYGVSGWVGLSPTTANFGLYLRSAGFNADPLYDLLDGSALVNLAGTPPSAGPLPSANGGVPSGVIFQWFGLIANIPSGYVFCDGSNGTPDLRERFVVGASVDDSGTAKTVITGSALQTSEGQLPATTVPTGTYLDNAGAGFIDGIVANQVNDHGSPISGSFGTGTAVIARFYALAYIMKT